jgi:hypothetical protein
MQIINKSCVPDPSRSDKGFQTVFLPCEVPMKPVPAGVKVASADITRSLAFKYQALLAACTWQCSVQKRMFSSAWVIFVMIRASGTTLTDSYVQTLLHYVISMLSKLCWPYGVRCRSQSHV